MSKTWHQGLDHPAIEAFGRSVDAQGSQSYGAQRLDQSLQALVVGRWRVTRLEGQALLGREEMGRHAPGESRQKSDGWIVEMAGTPCRQGCGNLDLHEFEQCIQRSPPGLLIGGDADRYTPAFAEAGKRGKDRRRGIATNIEQQGLPRAEAQPLQKGRVFCGSGNGRDVDGGTLVPAMPPNAEGIAFDALEQSAQAGVFPVAADGPAGAVGIHDQRLVVPDGMIEKDALGRYKDRLACCQIVHSYEFHCVRARRIVQTGATQQIGESDGRRALPRLS